VKAVTIVTRHGFNSDLYVVEELSTLPTIGGLSTPHPPHIPSMFFSVLDIGPCAHFSITINNEEGNAPRLIVSNVDQQRFLSGKDSSAAPRPLPVCRWHMSPYCPWGGGKGSVNHKYTFDVTITKILQKMYMVLKYVLEIKKFVYKNRLHMTLSTITTPR